ncbi:MAG: hypothetical protein ABSA77_13235 [Thermoguttaceae bacterium]
MNTPADHELTEWLMSADAKSFAERIERLQFVRKQYNHEYGILFPGGPVPARAFEEMQFSYVNGAYLSCVLTAQVVLEHVMVGMLDWIDRDDLDGFGFLQLCQAALSENLITQQEFDQFNSLRRLRNPYTHSSPFMGRSCIIRRTVESGNPPEELFKADAQVALRAVISLFSHPPFALD